MITACVTNVERRFKRRVWAKNAEFLIVAHGGYHPRAGHFPYASWAIRDYRVYS
jgi:hypothetical protein